jgi:hypothetical protein
MASSFFYSKNCSRSVLAKNWRIAGSTMQRRQLFESTLREQLFDLKKEDAIKKSENLDDPCP